MSAAPQTSPSAGSLLSTFVIVLVAIAALFAIDFVLARMQNSEERSEAARQFAEGRRLMASGDPAAALERFRDAVSTDRNNRDYRLGLAEALLAAGKTADAQTALADLLETDSTDGSVNIEMARALVKEGKINDAISFYHRAIYGHWPDRLKENQAKARFELIELLTKQQAKQELLAELLPLQDEAPEDLEVRERLGRLFLAAGSPSHAADIFRDLIHRNPHNAAAYSGMGEAEFARGNYSAAQADFAAASRVAPDDQGIRQRFEETNLIMTLDPMRRGLEEAERYRRSLKLLHMVVDRAGSCLDSNPEAQPRLDDARKALKSSVTPMKRGEAYDSNLDLAAELWQLEKKSCNLVGAGSALDLVIAKIAQ